MGQSNFIQVNQVPGLIVILFKSKSNLIMTRIETEKSYAHDKGIVNRFLWTNNDMTRSRSDFNCIYLTKSSFQIEWSIIGWFMDGVDMRGSIVA